MGEFKPEFNEKNQEKVNGEWVYTAKSIVRELGCTIREASHLMETIKFNWELQRNFGMKVSEDSPIKTVHRNDVPNRPKIKIIDEKWFDDIVGVRKRAKSSEYCPYVIDSEDEEVMEILNLESGDPISAYMALYNCKGPAAQKMFDYRMRIDELQQKLLQAVSPLRSEDDQADDPLDPGDFLNATEDDFPPEHEILLHGKKFKARGFLSLSDFVSVKDIRERYKE